MIPKEFDLQDKLAVVTGVKDGWFLDIAEALADAGADVIIVSGRSRKITNTINDIRSHGRSAKLMAADITNSCSVDKVREAIESKYGRVDILVNAADLLLAKPITQITDDDWLSIMTHNLNAAFICSRAFIPRMIARKKGKIINIASGLAVRGVANFSAYSASKGGLVAFSRALAVELGKDNIRVTAVAPGWYTSEKPENKQDDELAKWIPLRRKVTGSDIASLVVFLASDAADYVTGHIFFVDGGLQVHS